MGQITRLFLNDFRNYRDALVEPGAGFVLLTGPNGAGKTNVLEAVSLLTPGRGLRQVPISEMARSDGPGGFAVAARLEDETELGTGISAESPRSPPGPNQWRAGFDQFPFRTTCPPSGLLRRWTGCSPKAREVAGAFSTG